MSEIVPKHVCFIPYCLVVHKRYFSEVPQHLSRMRIQTRQLRQSDLDQIWLPLLPDFWIGPCLSVQNVFYLYYSFAGELRPGLIGRYTDMQLAKCFLSTHPPSSLPTAFLLTASFLTSFLLKLFLPRQQYYFSHRFFYQY